MQRPEVKQGNEQETRQETKEKTKNTAWLGGKTKEQMMWEAQWRENMGFVGPRKLYGLCSSSEKPSRGFKI